MNRAVDIEFPLAVLICTVFHALLTSTALYSKFFQKLQLKLQYTPDSDTADSTFRRPALACNHVM